MQVISVPATKGPSGGWVHWLLRSQGGPNGMVQACMPDRAVEVGPGFHLMNIVDVATMVCSECRRLLKSYIRRGGFNARKEQKEIRFEETSGSGGACNLQRPGVFSDPDSTPPPGPGIGGEGRERSG